MQIRNFDRTKSHIIVTKIATIITVGTKTLLTLSAIFDIGAFEFPASSTSFIICERVVSSPTLTASIFK